MNKLYIVEVIRYGSPELGVQFYGVFNKFDMIEPKMAEYNQYRGGKYPAYYVTETELNPDDMQPSGEYIRIRYDLQ